MRRFLRENALGLVAFAAFLAFLGGQTLTGARDYNDDQVQHHEATVGLITYLGTGHFREATFENWESEFLQMGAYVLLTIKLKQKGSAESKALDGTSAVDEDPALHRGDPDAPWPVRRGGIALALYRNSLSIAFALLFLLSFALHANGGATAYSAEQVAHGAAPMNTWQFMTTARFWFQSLQNWQSEFLSVAAIIVLSIFLRQQGSPESKPVHAPAGQTGE